MNPYNPPSASQPLVKEDFTITYPWWGWVTKISRILNGGFSGTLALAKLTGGGADGSATFVNGILTAYVAPT